MLPPFRVLSFRLACTLAGMLLASHAAGAGADCPDQPFTFFEAQGYRIRDVRVVGPFLPAASFRDDVLAPAGIKPGAAVTHDGIEAGQRAIRERLGAMPTLFDSLASATVVLPDVTSCDESSRQLDVVYRALTTKVPIVLSRTVESREAVARDPAARLALGPTPVRYRLAPRVSYDRSTGLTGGATLSMEIGRLFDRFEADVQASRTTVLADVALATSRERDAGLLRTFDWRLAYHHADRPTDQQMLKERAFVTQLTTATRPLGSRGAILRMASLFEAGEQRTALSPTDLPEGYVPSAGFATWKNAVGLDLRSRRHGLQGAYGVQLGFTGDANAIDYVKQIADLEYDLRVAWKGAAWSHRPLDIAARGSAGRLSGDGAIPATERFFGGAAPTPFLNDPSWTVRGNPALRSFPSNWFNRTAAGAALGGDGFASFTATLTMPFWARPLVPAEVSADGETRTRVDAALTSGETALDATYRMSDPVYNAIVEQMQTLRPVLRGLETRVAALQATGTLAGDQRDAAQSCSTFTTDVLANIEAEERGNLLPLLGKPVDEGDATLPALEDSCLTRLNGALRDTELTRLGKQLVTTREAMNGLVARIDVARTQALAARDMAFPREVVQTIFDELNLWSVGPALLLDVARIGLREPASRQATRYGVGAGVRVTLASALQLTAGYAWNVNRQEDEPRGAAFMTLDVSPLFGR